MFDHRLADPLGSCDVLLICIILKALHRFLLIVPCIFDSPYLLWGQQVSVFSELYLALRGAQRDKGVRGNFLVLRNTPKTVIGERARWTAVELGRNAQEVGIVEPRPSRTTR